MKRTNKRDGQHGGVIVEAGLALPFLAFALLLLSDAVQISKNYIALTLIARETVMTASSLDSLDNKFTVSAKAPSAAEVRQCYDATMVNYQPPPGMKKVCANRVLAHRIAGLRTAYDLSTTDQGMTVEIDRDAGKRLVKAQVRCNLPKLSGLLKGISITTTAAGSYDA